MQCVEVVHAVTTARFGPVMPYMIETWPEIMLMMVAGTKNGEILRGPPSTIFRVIGFDGADAADPGAHRYADAMRLRLFDLDARILDRVSRRSDAVVNEGSHLRASFGSRYCVTSKFLMIPAMRVEKALASNASTRVIPLTPSRTFFHPSATVLPVGEIRPRPVTTTRRLDTVAASSYERNYETVRARKRSELGLALS